MPNRSQAQFGAPGAAASKPSKANKKPSRSAAEATGDGPETDPKPPPKKIMADSGAFFLKPAPPKAKST